MNNAQQLWWQQARSDHALFVHLLHQGMEECHLLHYLQMTTEKISKAYAWRSGMPPPKSHIGFVRFLKAVHDRSADLPRIAAILGFRRGSDLETWLKTARPLALRLQCMAPAEAGNGENPEYPWPHESPVAAPAGHSFGLWRELVETGRGRKLLDFVARTVTHLHQFP